MYWTVHGRLNASSVYVSSKVQEKQSDCSRRPAEQSASCWSPSAGPWWRPAPPAACPAPPSVWRSVPQPPRCPAPLAAPPPAAEWPVGGGGGGAGAARPTNRVRTERRDHNHELHAATHEAVFSVWRKSKEKKRHQHFMLSKVEFPSGMDSEPFLFLIFKWVMPMFFANVAT